jgi:ABC-type multidrug transport system fused ATPase/permease subunit
MNEKFKNKLKVLIKVVKYFYGRYTTWVVLRDVLFIAITVAEMISITIMGKFLDATADLLTSGVTDFNVSQYIETDSFFFLMMMLLLWIVTNIGGKVRSNIYDNLNDKLWADANFDMVKKVSNSNLEEVMDQKFQDLLAYIPAYSINSLLVSYSAFSDILSQGIRLATALVILFVDLRWSIFLLVVFVLPEVIMGYIKRKEIRKYNEEEVHGLKLVNYLTSYLALNNNFFSELRVNNTFKYIKNVLEKRNEDYQKGLFHRRKHFYIDNIATSVFGQVFRYFYIIYLIGYSIIQKITIGSFSALFNYVGVVYNSAFNMLDTVVSLEDNLSYAESFFNLMEWEGFGDIKYGTEKLPKGELDLKFVHLDFAYPDQPEIKVLENIDFEIKPGEKVVFYGSDSSGKSSLVKLLTGMYEILVGDYFIGGLSIRELERGELKGRTSVLFQNFINYNFTLEKNITIGLDRKNIDRKLFQKVVKVADLKGLLKRKNIDENTILGREFEDGVELSPGYWQRIAIARMLYRNKDIFIMDEPFTFIDSKSKSKMIDDIIEFVGEDRILIYITRSTEDLEKFDKVFYFDKGKIKESGHWKELMKNKGKTYKKAEDSKKK